MTKDVKPADSESAKANKKKNSQPEKKQTAGTALPAASRRRKKKNSQGSQSDSPTGKDDRQEQSGTRTAGRKRQQTNNSKQTDSQKSAKQSQPQQSQQQQNQQQPKKHKQSEIVPNQAKNRSSQRNRKNAGKAKQTQSVQSNKLKIIPLGGMREIGKNLTVYEYGQDMIIVDCGIAFPDEDMPGIDVVIPDFSYVLQNKDRLRGIFLTHGHEDHIGSLAWLCKDVNVPVYGNKLTIALARQKIEDRGTGVKGVQLNTIKCGELYKAGCFEVEFIHSNHSIADANCLVIRTPVGIIFHTGDFKVDFTPINGDPINLARIAEIGSEGVMLMFCESTNVGVKGYSPSESTVGETFIDLFAKAEGRIFVATFSSHVFRVQQIITAAERYGRKVALLGRSMLNVFDAASSLGYLTMKEDTLVDINQLDKYPPEKVVLITTGSQGEPMSALTRMAFSEHRTVEIQKGDTVILSSSPIPGNEKPIYRVINELFRRGARVVYESLADIHVSGHAYREEIKLMHRLVKPKMFIPAHGEYRHLYQHAELAHDLGLGWDSIFILNNGDIFETDGTKADITGFTNAAGVMIDGSGMGDVDTLVLQDRLLLADDGVVSVFLAVDQQTGTMIGEPDIQARGFIYESESNRITQDCSNRVRTFVQRAEASDKPLAAMIRSGALRDQLRDLLFQKTRRRPVILVSLIEI